MNKILIISALGILLTLALVSFKTQTTRAGYTSAYNGKLSLLKSSHLALYRLIETSDMASGKDRLIIKEAIALARGKLKGMDFWLRYLEPIAYKKMNGPLPVEWETEVFEKFEKPYKREGAGLTLAELYLEEEYPRKDSLRSLIASSLQALETFGADSITGNLKTHHHFFLCNRLFLLNLASIYTTGFECPDTSRVIPELRAMLADVDGIYRSYNDNFPQTPLTVQYTDLFNRLGTFVKSQPEAYSSFDHFSFIRDYVNPLFALNQQFINNYGVVSKSFVDYSLNRNVSSIFSKDLYNGQSSKGIFLRVKDEKVLAEIDKIGKLLFYDPILSGNNLRSCASCHKSAEYFTDTSRPAPLQFNRKDFLTRNAPSLVNAGFNHLLMLDGRQISMQHQAKEVITNPEELGCDKNMIVKKVLSCPDYKKAFNSFLQYTPQETEVTLDHIVSAITFYYSKFSNFYADFDNAINNRIQINEVAKQGFNLFMSKAQCATCHFVPQFNGVKPPFVSSEFEVLGVPGDTAYKSLSVDKGRYDVNPATETYHAFRTGSIRNARFTGPYMHNGVFTSLNQVIDFYDNGGGAGRGLEVDNQTLSSDSLRLTPPEKQNLISFIDALNEHILFEEPPLQLPYSKDKALNKRRVGGEY